MLAETMESMQASSDSSSSSSNDQFITLNNTGEKLPVFLFHPGAGEILVFLNLFKYLDDKPYVPAEREA
jgi:hypothetical protein